MVTVSERPFLSIVIPVYNEENCIVESLSKLARFAGTRFWKIEIVVVDDGSTDGTAGLVEHFSTGHTLPLKLVRLTTNLGKGAAVKRGVHSATGGMIAYMDADLSYDLVALEEAARLITEESADLVIGDRTHAQSKNVRPYPWLRKITGQMYSILIQILLFREVFDTQCGFKCCAAEAAHELFPLLSIPGFGFDVEFLYLAAKRGKKIRRIPVILNHSHDSKVRLVRDSMVMLSNLFMIRRKNRLGGYDREP